MKKLRSAINIPAEMIPQYDKLNHFILKSNVNKCKMVAISSSKPKEGSTYIALTYALYLSLKHKSKVLVVDANRKNPSIKKYFKKSPKQGIYNFLNGECHLNEIIYNTNTPNLFLVDIGRGGKEDACGNLRKIEGEILKADWDFDFIIFDCPNLNMSSDALAIASQCDGLLLIVRSGSTRREVVRYTLKLLDDWKINVLGIVLNRRKFYIPNFLYKWL